MYTPNASQFFITRLSEQTTTLSSIDSPGKIAVLEPIIVYFPIVAGGVLNISKTDYKILK